MPTRSAAQLNAGAPLSVRRAPSGAYSARVLSDPDPSGDLLLDVASTFYPVENAPTSGLGSLEVSGKSAGSRWCRAALETTGWKIAKWDQNFLAGLNSLRVLIVDDNQHMRAIVTTVLAGVGIRDVREVRDGADGLNALREWQADVAIVDFLMSPIDGVEFTRMVRNAPDSKNPYLPIVMMTGHAEKARVVEARDAGVTEFIAKPLTAKSVLDRLQVVIYHPRTFVRSDSYFGPDRRRQDLPAYGGPRRRASDFAGAEGTVDH